MTMARALPALAVTFVGALGAINDVVTGVDAADAVEEPNAFVATTVKV